MLFILNENQNRLGDAAVVRTERYQIKSSQRRLGSFLKSVNRYNLKLYHSIINRYNPLSVIFFEKC